MVFRERGGGEGGGGGGGEENESAEDGEPPDSLLSIVFFCFLFFFCYFQCFLMVFRERGGGEGGGGGVSENYERWIMGRNYGRYRRCCGTRSVEASFPRELACRFCIAETLLAKRCDWQCMQKHTGL